MCSVFVVVQMNNALEEDDIRDMKLDKPEKNLSGVLCDKKMFFLGVPKSKLYGEMTMRLIGK